VSASVTSSERTSIEEAVRSGFETLLGVGNPGENDDFFDLGGDSLIALSLLLHIEELTGMTLPVTAIYDAPTIARLTDRLMHAGGPGCAGAPGRDTNLVDLRPGDGNQPPLFLLHGLGGSVMVLRDLARQIGGNRPVWGLEAQGLDGRAQPLDDVHAMADNALAMIRTVAPHGPYLIAGYSFGGTVALEVARRLDDAGEKIALLAMLDTWPDPSTWRRSVKLRTMLRQMKVYFSLTVWSRLIRREFGKLRGRTPAGIAMRLLRGAVRAVTIPTDIMGTAWVYDIAGKAPQANDFLLPLDRGAVTAANYKTIDAVTTAARHAFYSYRPAPYAGDLLVLHATQRQVVPYSPKAVWGHLVGSLSVIELPTDHQALVRGAAKATAERLTLAIDAALAKLPS
jgi:thioesterase domain-containing protein/acyl carrier protein